MVIVECKGYAGVLNTIPDEVEIYEGEQAFVEGAMNRFAERHYAVEFKILAGAPSNG